MDGGSGGGAAPAPEGRGDTREWKPFESGGGTAGGGLSTGGGLSDGGGVSAGGGARTGGGGCAYGRELPADDGDGTVGG